MRINYVTTKLHYTKTVQTVYFLSQTVVVRNMSAMGAFITL